TAGSWSHALAVVPDARFLHLPGGRGRLGGAVGTRRCLPLGRRWALLLAQPVAGWEEPATRGGPIHARAGAAGGHLLAAGLSVLHAAEVRARRPARTGTLGQHLAGRRGGGLRAPCQRRQ